MVLDFHSSFVCLALLIEFIVNNEIKMNEKKEYITPQMTEVALNHQARLMDSSKNPESFDVIVEPRP